MNPVLAQILETGQVTDGSSSYPLTFHVDRAEGELLQQLIREIRPRRTLEVGMAYGISTLFICEALSSLPFPTRHTVIDPFQSTDWRGIGLRNVTVAGYRDLVDFREELSEFVLPRMLAEQTSLDMALIDGWHTFDQALMEFYFVNRMLPVGGVVVFDDADRPSVNKALRYILTYPAYEVLRPQGEVHNSRHTWLGRVRRLAVELPYVRQAVAPHFRQRPWDLGIEGTCVALKKRANDSRDDKTFFDF